MPEVTGLLLTLPVLQEEKATEIWIKFRNEGYYVYLNFEQPIPDKIELHKLVGKGNALNCSEYKKDNELIQYNSKNEIINILNNSINYKGNLDETVLKVMGLFENIQQNYFY